MIRALANVITVRGNTFKIWALAQSIKQPPVRGANPNWARLIRILT